MRNPIDVLNSLSDKSKNPFYRFERLYRNLYNPEFYLLAYKNIYANQGSMTPGVNGITLDGMSVQRVNRVIESLKNHSYRPNPARREYIAKKNSTKKRPLGIPSGDDKLVQEVVRMILESIYEPNFSDASHGFRPHKSCHTALLHLQRTFSGAKWFVEGDIEACFDSFDHHVLVEILRRRINDDAFIALMWKFLKAGYMEQWEYHKTYSGVPQGSGVSPILANIYLHELDKYMEEYKANFDISKRTENPEYHKLSHKIHLLKQDNAAVWDSLNLEEKKRRAKSIRQLHAIQHSLPVRPVREQTYKSLQYVRYADDFVIGIIGSKEDAEVVKSNLAKFLKEKLCLTLSPKKTQITHTAKRARFLGYDITISRNQGIKRNKNGIRRRAYNGVVKLYIPHEKWESKLRNCGAIYIKKDAITGKENWKAIHRGKLMNLTDIEILSKYNSEVRGFYNYYSIACNAAILHSFSGLMKYSMLKTFGAKYRTQCAKIKARYVKNGNFTVPYETKSGVKEAIYYNKGFKRQNKVLLGQIDILETYKRHDKPNSLAARLRAKTCELCGSSCDDIEIHQVKRLKDLTNQTEWEIVMRNRRRKTLAVCPACHGEIHKSDKIVRG